MEFLHISDLHYRMHYPAADEGYPSIFKNMTSPLEQLRSGMKKIQMENLAFVLISGDLTENGDESDYRELKTQLDDIFGEVPYIVTVGNHDNLEAFHAVWGKNPAQETYGTVQCFGNVTVIALNNASGSAGQGEIGMGHCRWLERCLTESVRRGDRVILMMHHPLIFDPASPIPAVDFSPEFLKVIKRNPPAAILCGHTHNELCGSFEGILYATAGSMSFKGYQRGGGSVCFREYASMNLCKIEQQFICIQEVPVTENGALLGEIEM